MFLVRLIYASKISSGFGPKDIENILQVKVSVVKSTGQEFIRNILG